MAAAYPCSACAASYDSCAACAALNGQLTYSVSAANLLQASTPDSAYQRVFRAICKGDGDISCAVVCDFECGIIT